MVFRRFIDAVIARTWKCCKLVDSIKEVVLVGIRKQMFLLYESLEDQNAWNWSRSTDGQDAYGWACLHDEPIPSYHAAIAKPTACNLEKTDGTLNSPAEYLIRREEKKWVYHNLKKMRIFAHYRSVLCWVRVKIAVAILTCSDAMAPSAKKMEWRWWNVPVRVKTGTKRNQIWFQRGSTLPTQRSVSCIKPNQNQSELEKTSPSRPLRCCNTEWSSLAKEAANEGMGRYALANRPFLLQFCALLL